VRSAKSDLASCKIQVKKRCCVRKEAEDEYGVNRDRRYTRMLNSRTTLAKLKSLAINQAEERLSVELLPKIVGEDDTSVPYGKTLGSRNAMVNVNALTMKPPIDPGLPPPSRSRNILINGNSRISKTLLK
jgi:hypothetical protein